jgi:ethanolamine ammonia-lyase small subunit
VNLEGDMDLHGFADLDDNVTPAYQNITAKVRIKAGGTKKDIAELLKFTSAHSPMCDSVSGPVDVSFSLVHNGKALA